jgi:hypothetical protein
MFIFTYSIKETVGGYFFTKISIPINYKKYKESLGDALMQGLKSSISPHQFLLA